MVATASSQQQNSILHAVPEVLARDSRARRFGIDCPSELRWHAKEPGGDYKQKLLLKNISNQVIKFKYVLPKTSFFFLNFPDVVTLSPGMAATVDVSFRPIRSELYDDVIEFLTSNGNFFVRVIATLPEFGVHMQEYLDFGFATCKEESRRTFVLRNVGEVDAPFELLVEKPFSVEPKTGNIKPGNSSEIGLVFTPQDASVFVGTVVCKQPAPRPALQMKISGIGKIPHIAVSTHEINFGAVLTSTNKVEVPRPAPLAPPPAPSTRISPAGRPRGGVAGPGAQRWAAVGAGRGGCRRAAGRLAGANPHQHGTRARDLHAGAAAAQPRHFVLVERDHRENPGRRCGPRPGPAAGDGAGRLVRTAGEESQLSCCEGRRRVREGA